MSDVRRERKEQRLTALTSVQVYPATQLVAPVQPVPPHCPYSATVPVPDGALPLAVPLLVELAADELAATPPEGMVVGTVDGWLAVFHVAVVG